jgi:N-acetyl-anhydromuramyl-L-alanine amidase AmpD
MTVIPNLSVADRQHSHVLQQPLAAPRRGIMLHYDDSSRDDWAVAWFHDPRCTNGYTWIVLDDGRVIELADPGMRTPHAGPCRTPNANSAYYGIAATTNGLVLATDRQIEAIARTCAAIMRHHQWPAGEATTSITGHDREAIWTPAYTKKRELWGSTGRKIDPKGRRPDGRPIIDLPKVAGLTQQLLQEME